MKLCRSALALLLATAASSLLDGAAAANSLSSFQASDPTAIKNLLAKSNRLPKQRRLGDEEAEEEEEEEDEFGFMMNYAVKLLSCEAGMPYAGYDQDGNQNDKEYSSVVYRLCPLASDEGCDGTTGSDGCSSGYGDYVVGINTYVDAYAETMRDRRRRLADDFDLAEYAECKEIEFEQQEQDEQQDDGEDEADEDEGDQEEGEEDGEDRRRRLADQQEGDDAVAADYDQQYYVGPSCSADGTDVILDLFTEYTCQTATASGTYEALSYGASLPYSSGGLGFACMSCSQDNDGDGNYETAEYCKKLYEFSGKCETNMEIYSNYYGKNEGECEYIAQLSEIAAQNSSNSSGGGANAGKVIGWIILVLVVVGGIAFAIMQKKKRTTGVSDEALVGEHADRIA